MTDRTQELLDQALALSERERAELVTELLASLGPDAPTADSEAWLAELERRAAAARAGERGVSWESARSEAERRIDEK
jgi:putative addiction module component (TIGR02574 family)